jgi:hypothetical protein
MANLIPTRIRWLVDVILFPGNIVRSSAISNTTSLIGRSEAFLRLNLFFVINIVLYALPLSLAGIALGVSEQPPPPLVSELVGTLPESPLIEARGSWNVFLRLVNNSISLITFTLLSYIMYHIGVLFTRKSKGALVSYYTIMISTSIYLALIFNISWYMVAETGTAGDLIDWSVRQFFISSADLVGVDTGINSTEFRSIDTLSAEGEIGFTLLGIFLCYYIYVLYVGARSSHGLTRYESLAVIIFVSISPAIFGVASALVTQVIELPDILTI